MTTANYIFNPTDLVLELDQASLDRAWSASQAAANPSSRWQNYLNQLALAVFLPWLQAEEDAAAKTNNSSAAQSAIWEVVNGTAIATKDATLVLIPSEAADLSELRVPQEWIDIPSWAADYYLAVQVNIEEGYLRVWGYGTHQQLQQGHFSHSDRTYSLTDDELIGDLNALWVARELCPDEVTKANLEPIAALESDRAQQLIVRLGSAAVYLPRLEVPFATWGALLQDADHCQNLAAVRRGKAINMPVMQWIKQGLSELSSELGWRQIELTPSAEGARGKALATPQVPAVGLAKRITIADIPYELKVLPLADAGAWRFELCCLTPGCMIPAGFKLKLMAQDLQDFEGNENLATEAVTQLAIEVDLEPGESLVWQVEPTPDNYQPEVLQF
ncbi:MAG: DUF1822 family protein [Cyanobacteria bacterium J06623_7]